MTESGKSQVFQDSWLHDQCRNKSMMMKTTSIHDQNRDSVKNCISFSVSSFEDSVFSNGSSSSSSSSSFDTADDDVSSPESSSSSSSQSGNPIGALYDLSDLMEDLPIKRGLSKFYKGKSESFTSLSMVTSVEDLVKKGTVPYTRKMKASKSYAAGLNSYKPYTLPKPIISKKTPRASFSPSFPSKRENIITSH